MPRRGSQPVMCMQCSRLLPLSGRAGWIGLSSRRGLRRLALLRQQAASRRPGRRICDSADEPGSPTAVSERLLCRADIAQVCMPVLQASSLLADRISDPTACQFAPPQRRVTTRCAAQPAGPGSASAATSAPDYRTPGHTMASRLRSAGADSGPSTAAGAAAAVTSARCYRERSDVRGTATRAVRQHGDCVREKTT